MKTLKKIIVISLLIAALAVASFFIFTKPSNDRDWTPDQAILPWAEINGNLVKIHNIRNFRYVSTSSYEADYYDKTFDSSEIKDIYYIVEPFSGYAGAAHTFLSFEFKDGQFVSVSVEIRKEKGESFSAVKGLFNQYELMYVIADERDVVKLRSNYREDLVYVYPTKTDQKGRQKLFLDMMKRANKLKEKPEFYNTLTNTCTTNIARHVNKIVKKNIPLSYKVLFPKYSDELAYDLDLINTELSLEEARTKYLINEKAAQYADDPEFSLRIRGR